ncbi:YfiR/HmsC family protein [Aquimarina muelleri]|uniref:histidine kinase n=1 Tax=Aquimarina muelleri TaxID=279356 RepID=A0A918N309_9FLAO|nr:YfiR/HmsC family protein [Aquimarina muelleri]MCX2764284.1 YfiR/HmsC family protein [Aquimarina muelleri]GGX16135.1 hypothetical protein GCM10007384_17110 [Aquimarina muelleri]
MIYRHQSISIIYSSFTIIVIWFVALFSPLKVQAQEIENEEVKRLQRAIFIFNFAQQVGWPDIQKNQDFKIGVLGPDRTILDLSTLAKKRKIHDKNVEIVRFQFAKDVKDIQLLYVNHKYNYDIHYILNKISGKNILLVSEDYNFNASMINMVNVGDSFEYEINTNRIYKEELAFTSSLKKHAITSSEKWKRLYRKTEKVLYKVQEDKNNQDIIIKRKENQIKYQKNKIKDHKKEIFNKEGEIEELYTQNEIQLKKYEEKVVIERELEKNIQEQVTFIKNQNEKIVKSNQEIKQQKDFLIRQIDKIKEQEKILNKQADKISLQKKINILLIVLILLAIGASFFIYRGYVEKKIFNKELENKNKAIHAQSLELEIKNQELEQFAYIASHDLQEPLNTISSFIGMLEEDYGENFDDVGKESMIFIKDASIRMKKLIDALLEYSRLGRSRDYQKVDCNIILGELKNDLKSILDKTKAQVSIEKLPEVEGSEIELRLLFQNLISNGIKFRIPDTIPIIHISSTRINDPENKSKGYWQFMVKDNGIGIPKEHQERIFAIFQRLHSREEYEGTGIGLAHCKKIVEAHGGKIWLESKQETGSTFYFTIPFLKKTFSPS